MSYRNKTYVIFDGDTDMHYYTLMKAWKENENIDFNFYNAHDINTSRDSSDEESIKSQLRERMANSKQVIVLVGENTKNLRKFVPWEIELARKQDLPILLVNLNKKRGYDSDRCPATVKDEVYTMSVSFGPKIVQYALDNFPDDYNGTRDRKTKGHTWRYKDSVYDSLENE